MPRTGRPKLLGQQVYIRLEPAVHEKLDKYIEQNETGRLLPTNEDYYWTEAAALRYDTINVYI